MWVASHSNDVPTNLCPTSGSTLPTWENTLISCSPSYSEPWKYWTIFARHSPNWKGHVPLRHGTATATFRVSPAMSGTVCSDGRLPTSSIFSYLKTNRFSRNHQEQTLVSPQSAAIPCWVAGRTYCEQF